VKRLDSARPWHLLSWQLSRSGARAPGGDARGRRPRCGETDPCGTGEDATRCPPRVVLGARQLPWPDAAAYVESLGGRWARTIDPTSTPDPYSAGLRLRVVPALGHLPIGMLTAGLIDRAIDRWELHYSASTVKNTVAALVLVLDEAVRDELLRRNPAKDRARRKRVGRTAPVEVVNPRDLALPDVATLHRLTNAVVAAGGQRDATNWDQLVIGLGLAALVRHSLRHTAPTWMADSGVRCTSCSGWPAIRTRRSRPVTCTRTRPPCASWKRIFGMVGAKWGPSRNGRPRHRRVPTQTNWGLTSPSEIVSIGRADRI
jgi:hypothetical protein